MVKQSSCLMLRTFGKKNRTRDNEMAQWIKVVAAKSDDLCSIS